MSFLARLTGRERALVLVAMPLACLLAGWRLGWAPLADLRAAREAEVAGYRQVIEAVSAHGAAPLAAAPEAAPLATRATSTAEASDLALSRLEPEGDALRVAVAEAPFAQVTLWLADLEAAGVLVTAVEIDRRTAPGAVTARVLLEDAQ